jgi:hypothetical protein
MTAPSGFLRDLREAAARRRFELAKLLRQDSTLTNVQLAAKLNVSRNTVAEDRKVLWDQLVKGTVLESEVIRAGVVQKLLDLKAEVYKHRKDGLLSLSAIDELVAIIKVTVELTGCRKAVIEKKSVNHSVVSFRTYIGKEPVGTFEMTSNPPKLEAEFITEPAKLMGGSDDEE